jgi:hypothetical protein
VDINLYLLALIIDLCNKILVKKGFTLKQVKGVRFNKSQNLLYKRIYLALQRELQVKYTQDNNSGLEELFILIKARKWIKKHITFKEDLELLAIFIRAKFK